MDKPYSLPYLIIVSGASGTGKTMLARRLSNHFALPLIAVEAPFGIRGRHACHMDHLRIPDLSNRLEQGLSVLQPAPLNGHLIELDTTNVETIDYEQLFSRIGNMLAEEHSAKARP